MTGAREGEDLSEVEEEKATDIVSNWDSPDLAVDLVDQIWDMVKGWLADREPAASDFFHYCRNLCDNQGERDEVWVWMLNLIAHFVAEDESFLASVHTAKDWRELALVDQDDWEVPPPLWLVRREEELKKKHEEEEKLKELKEEKEIDETKESLVTTSPLDLDWGKELPAPTPSVAAPSASMWTCGGPGRKMFLVSTCLLCRRGRGKVQLRQLVAGDGYRCGRRRRKWPDSH